MRLLRCGVVASALLHNSPQSAIRKWEYRTWCALALDADVSEREDDYPQVPYPQPAGAAPLDTVSLKG
jgi:hypothetical protein